MKAFSRDAITALRLSMGLKQVDFARRLGPSVNRQVINQWESGENMPSIRSLVRIANTFGAPIESFFIEDGGPIPEPSSDPTRSGKLLVKRIRRAIADAVGISYDELWKESDVETFEKPLLAAAGKG